MDRGIIVTGFRFIDMVKDTDKEEKHDNRFYKIRKILKIRLTYEELDEKYKDKSIYIRFMIHNEKWNVCVINFDRESRIEFYRFGERHGQHRSEL